MQSWIERLTIQLKPFTEDGVSEFLSLNNQIASLLRYQGRGNLSAWDKTSGWTMDGGYYDWDLSSIIPSGAKAAHLYINIYDTNVGRGITFRPNGYGNYNSSFVRILVSGYTMPYDCPIELPPDDSRIIEYASYTGQSLNTVQASIKGWWF